METDATPNDTKPKSRRRWYQYSLGTMLIVVTVIGYSMSSLVDNVREGRQQQAALAPILKLGGRVYYGRTTPAPVWLQELLGRDSFRSVIMVDLSNTTVSAADLEYLKGLTTLKSLVLRDTLVNDDGLEHLKGLPQLLTLWLERTHVTDAGLEHLKGLNQLRELYLTSTKVTDAGVERLQESLPRCIIHR
jgi:Leucine Rich repeat